jgi:ribosome-binding ATPase YchF (GTP1/OBG family)
VLTWNRRIENLKDLVLYRFGSTGVVQVLSRAADLLGLVPVFPVRNIGSFTSGSGGSNSAVFRDCVLIKKWVVFCSLCPGIRLTQSKELDGWRSLSKGNG